MNCYRVSPLQLDNRYTIPTIKWEVWEGLLKDKRIVHIFVEHLDIRPTEMSKFSPIPVGLNPNEYRNKNPDNIIPLIQRSPTDIMKRELKVLFSNRLRNHVWFNERKAFNDICIKWKDCVVKFTKAGDFIEILKKYPFLICSHGGGIDPNPMAFTALLVGVIPIIRHFPGDMLYDNMPVIFVGSWNELEFLDLEKEREKLSHYFENTELREKVIEKLMSKYWWDQVISKLNGTTTG